MYKILLIDLDNTLLDFDKAEEKALFKTLNEFGKGYLDLNKFHIYKDEFKKINGYYWKEYEKGKIKKEELLVKRFEEFFGKYIKNTDGTIINNYYLNALSLTNDTCPNAIISLAKLKQYVKIYPVTNGVYKTQIQRLKNSGLLSFFDDLFISEKIGFQKPKTEFFDYVFENIKNTYSLPYTKKDVLLVGDSLSADITGGINYGIDTCWYNPNNNKSSLNYTYEIKDLLELIEIIKN